jgi:ABC-type transport system substrate-binding protein
MRGLSQPTGALVAPQVTAGPRVSTSASPIDPEASKKLLADAGYPQGFEVDFACPNNRYINDEEICQAVTAMWAKVGVKAKLRTLPLVTYFPMIQRYEASIYMLGWGVPTFDALYSLQSLTRSVGTGGDGNYNVGRYSNPRMDYLVDRIKKETDLPVRNRAADRRPATEQRHGVAHPSAQPDHSLGTEEERGCGSPRRQPSRLAPDQGELIGLSLHKGRKGLFSCDNFPGEFRPKGNPECRHGYSLC